MSSDTTVEAREIKGEYTPEFNPRSEIEREVNKMLRYCNMAFSYLYTLDTKLKEVFTYTIYENKPVNDWMVSIKYSEHSSSDVNSLVFPVSSILKTGYGEIPIVDIRTLWQLIVEFSCSCVGEKTIFSEIAPKLHRIFSGGYGVSMEALSKWFAVQRDADSLKNYLVKETAQPVIHPVIFQKRVPFFGKKIREYDWLSAYRQYGLEHAYIRVREKLGKKFGKWYEYPLLSDEGMAEYYDKYINEENEDKFEVAIYYKGKAVPLSLRIKVFFKDLWKGIKNLPNLFKRKKRTKEELCISLIQDYCKAKGKPMPPLKDILVELDQIERKQRHEKEQKKNKVARGDSYSGNYGSAALVRNNLKHYKPKRKHPVDGKCSEGCDCQGHRETPGDNQDVCACVESPCSSVDQRETDRTGNTSEFTEGNS